ncbi:MAG TPA: hypothetical protein VGG75_04220 [Trebonia sp.]
MTVLIVVFALLCGAAYGGYRVYQHFQMLLIVPGCQAGIGSNALGLDFEQAQDAATIADVAVYDHLPAQALTIAYATAYQESKLENLPYGTSDSVGIFQQRPSEGWGSVSQLEDPVYATQAFFETGPTALVKIPDYESMSISEAAQKVQASADGSAYQQWVDQSQLLTADFTTTPHAVTCWYNPGTPSGSQGAGTGATTTLNLQGAVSKLEQTFGSPRADGVVTGVTLASAGKSESFDTASGGGWAVANWLVTNAADFGITQIAYGGYQWTASLTETSWQPAPGTDTTSIVAS